MIRKLYIYPFFLLFFFFQTNLVNSSEDDVYKK